MSKQNKIVWTTKDGQQLNPWQIEPSHRKNILNSTIKKARQQITNHEVYTDAQILTAIMAKNPAIREIASLEGYMCSVIALNELGFKGSWEEYENYVDSKEF